MAGASDDKRDFFVSFNKADRAWATWVAWVLEEAGWSVWFQDWDFRGNFVEHMNRAHVQAHRTLAVLSDHYFNSDFTLAEWSARFAQDAAGREDRLVPVKVGPLTTETILAPILYADLTGCEQEEGQRRLLERVGKAVDASYRAKPDARPGFPGSASPARQVPDKPRFPVASHNLPQPNREFVGRVEALAEIGRALAASGRAAITQPQAITGLGGIGKTQLALHFAYAHLGDYELVRWLRAEEPATLAGDYAAMAPALGLDPETPDQAALIAAIRGRLEGQGRFLLVLDNVTEPGPLASYLPRTGPGHILITSRWQDWGETAETLELDIMSEPEALALLLGEPADDPAQQVTARLLAKDLGHLPLALAQARAFMRARKADVAGYRRQLATLRPQVMAWRPPNAAYPLSAAQTWQVSSEQAAKDCPAARDLLQLLAFFAPDAIPRELLDAEAELWLEGLRSSFERDSAIEALARFSLLRADTSALTVHRLVQAVTRDRLDEATAKARAEAAVRLVDAALPRPPREHANWPRIQALLPHAVAATAEAERLDAGLVTAAIVLNETAVFHDARADWAAAEPLFARAIAIGERTLGPEHPDLAKMLNNLAGLYRNTGRDAEAEPLYQRARAILGKALPPDHPHQAIIRANYASVLARLGRGEDAARLRAEAEAIRQRRAP